MYMCMYTYIFRPSLVAQTVKNLPAVQETWVWSLDREDPLEKGMATQSSILAWRIPRTEGSGGLQSVGLRRVGHVWVTNTIIFWCFYIQKDEKHTICLSVCLYLYILCMFYFVLEESGMCLVYWFWTNFGEFESESI